MSYLSLTAILLALLFTFIALLNQYLNVSKDVSRLPSNSYRKVIGSIVLAYYLSLFVFIVYHLVKFI